MEARGFILDKVIYKRQPLGLNNEANMAVPETAVP